MKVKVGILIILIAFFIVLISCSASGGSSSGGGGGGGNSSGDGDNTGTGTGIGAGTGTSSTEDKITGLDAKELEDANIIKVEWNQVTGFNTLNNDSYKIYRYTPNTTNNALVSAGIITDIDTNLKSDNGATPKIPYFYKVAYLKNGVEKMTNDGYSFGICTDEADQYENKKSISEMEDDNGTTIVGTFPTLNADWVNAIIYSCKDGDNGVITDVDYYKFNGTVTKTITFEIKFVNEADLNFPFTNNDIKFRYYYKDATDPNYPNVDYIEGTEYNYTIGASNTLPFGINTEDIFFKVYINNNSVDKTKNIIEKYKVKLSDTF